MDVGEAACGRPPFSLLQSMRMRAAIGALFLAAILAATASAHSASTGLQGVVTRGPITPVCQEGVPCSAPAKHATLTFSRNGVSYSATTDDQGHYLIHLAAGTWTVRIAPATKFGFKPQAAYVRAGVVRVQNFSIDTGIR